MLPDILDEEELKRTIHIKCYLHTVEPCIFIPIFLIPYFLRAVRLRKIFEHHKIYYLEKKATNKYSFEKRDKSVCIRELSLAIWFISIMIFLCIVLVFNLQEGFETDVYIPSHSLDDCMTEEARDDWPKK